jgi:hypothetical protein
MSVAELSVVRSRINNRAGVDCPRERGREGRWADGDGDGASDRDESR